MWLGLALGGGYMMKIKAPNAISLRKCRIFKM